METTSLTDPNTPDQPSDLAPAAVPSAPTFKEKAAAYTDLAIKRLVDILEKGTKGVQDEKPASDMAVITAATALLDRGHGKPTQFIEQTTKIQTLGDLLSVIGEKEKNYQEIVDAQVIKEPAQLPPAKPLEWGDVI